MPTAVQNTLARMRATLGGFSIAQKTIAVILIAALVLGTIALVSWLTKPSYTPLFSGIDPVDASAIVEQLQADGVPYELTAGGGTILVPEEHVYQERLTAAAAGLPSTSGQGGYSLLDTMGVTSSEFQQDVTYKRAIEGELAKTISAMDGVKTASVQLAIPEESVFVAEQADPTASVFVETKGGATLTGKQVQAIVNLTSASVEGMATTDVAVTDSTGAVLSQVGTGAVGGAGDQVSDYESKVQTAVQTMLDKVVGPGKSSVIVAADLDQSSGTKVTESFTQPETGPIALNESSTTEQYGAGSGGAGGAGATGVLGPDNIAVPNGTGTGTDAAGTATGDDGYVNESATKNNAVDKVTETMSVPAGGVSRQTVSVAVDANAAAGVNMQSINDLVRTAAGIDTARGDAVEVALVDFDTDGAEAAKAALAAADAAAASEAMWGTIRTVGIVALIVIALVVGLIVFAKKNKRHDREDVDLGELAAGNAAQTWDATMRLDLDDAGAASRRQLLADEAATVALPVAAPEPSPEYVSAERRRAEIDALAERDPEKTAELLRGLMDDRVQS
jgi:flagellar M-ring protein FliF